MVSGGVGVTLAAPTPDADKGCCPPVDEDGKKVPLSVRLRRHVKANYDAFPAGADGRIFIQSKQGGRAELLTANFVIRAAGHLGNSAGSLSTPAKEAATVLTARALHEPPRALALRAHYRPGRIILDLAQVNSTRCVVVTPRAGRWRRCRLATSCSRRPVPPCPTRYGAARWTSCDGCCGGGRTTRAGCW